VSRLDGAIVYEGDSTDAGIDPLDHITSGPGVLTIGIPARVLGPATYQVYLSFASDIDASGPAIDVPGIVGEFRLDDPTSRLGNRRAGYLSLKLDWQKAGAHAGVEALR
jgi:hypothetical protein